MLRNARRVRIIWRPSSQQKNTRNRNGPHPFLVWDNRIFGVYYVYAKFPGSVMRDLHGRGQGLRDQKYKHVRRISQFLPKILIWDQNYIFL